MKESVHPGKRSGPLRRRAEELIRANGSEPLTMTEKKLHALVYELRVRQIELERQNEELRQAQVELAESRDQYSDLYEFAPIGYVTLDRKGRITECNLASATLLGRNRIDLVGKPISHFLTKESRDDCHFHLRDVFENDAKQVSELSMQRDDGTPLAVRLESLRQQPQIGRHSLCRTALIDITDARSARRKLQQLNVDLEQQITLRTADLQRRTDELAQQSTTLELYKKDLQTLTSELMLTEERERRQLAEDLHDSLGQAVFQARMLLDREALNDQTIMEIRTVLDEIKKIVNTLTHELSPLLLRQMGLWSALEWLTRNFRQRYDVQVRLKGNEQDVVLEENVGLVLFRSIREILFNVAKHAETDFATVSLRHFNNSVEVSIRDGGKGFDLKNRSGYVPGGHFGLFSVSERLKYIGGSFDIRSKPGVGTTVTLRVPCKMRSQAATPARGRL